MVVKSLLKFKRWLKKERGKVVGEKSEEKQTWIELDKSDWLKLKREK